MLGQRLFVGHMRDLACHTWLGTVPCFLFGHGQDLDLPACVSHYAKKPQTLQLAHLSREDAHHPGEATQAPAFRSMLMLFMISYAVASLAVSTAAGSLQSRICMAHDARLARNTPTDVLVANTQLTAMPTAPSVMLQPDRPGSRRVRPHPGSS